MTDTSPDNLSDIDPAIVEGVLAHADSFIDADKRVDEIVAWGETELKMREADIKDSNGTLQQFKEAATEVEQMVAQKLKALQDQVGASATIEAVE
jgi:hypothetical protein